MHAERWFVYGLWVLSIWKICCSSFVLLLLIAEARNLSQTRVCSFFVCPYPYLFTHPVCVKIRLRSGTLFSCWGECTVVTKWYFIELQSTVNLWYFGWHPTERWYVTPSLAGSNWAENAHPGVSRVLAVMGDDTVMIHRGRGWNIAQIGKLSGKFIK